MAFALNELERLVRIASETPRKPAISDFYYYEIKEEKMENTLIIDELEGAIASADELLKAAMKDITNWFKENSEVFTLSDAKTLTVKKRDTDGGGYSKVAMIGGESFVPVSAYIGKRNAMIIEFKPTSVSPYLSMEMTEAEAARSLIGFKSYLAKLMSEVGTSVQNAREEKRRESENKKNAANFKKYEEIGFGSF